MVAALLNLIWCFHRDLGRQGMCGKSRARGCYCFAFANEIL